MSHEERLAETIKFRDLLNAGVDPADALSQCDIPGMDDDESPYGEDLGDECMEYDDPENCVIDLGWDEGVHIQTRRTSTTQPWAVEVMQRFEAAR